MPGPVAVIPARKGSKRLQKKNLLPFRGAPMLSHTVVAAVDSGVFDEVLFTSDDDDMLEVASRFGATPLWRPAHLATDDAELYPTVAHALRSVGRAEEEFVCLLMPNCPLRTADDVRRSFEAFTSQGRTFQISVFRYHMFNPFWALEGSSRGGLRPAFPEKFSHPSSSVLCPSGAIWWAKVGALMFHKDFYGPDLQPFELPWYRAVDIDTVEDYRMALIVAAAMESAPELFERDDALPAQAHQTASGE